MKKSLLLLVIIFFSVSVYAQSSRYHPFGPTPPRWYGHGFIVGEEPGHQFYLCKASVEGGMQPGKTWAGYDKCNVPYAGKELLVERFKKVKHRPRGHWRPYSGRLPDNAMRVGHEADGRALYLCQAYYHASWQPGKTWQGYNGCNIPYGGKELVIRPNYKIYVLDRRHRR